MSRLYCEWKEYRLVAVSEAGVHPVLHHPQLARRPHPSSNRPRRQPGGPLERRRGARFAAPGVVPRERLEGHRLLGLVPLMVGAAPAARQLAVWRLHEERRPRRALQPLAEAGGLRAGVPLLHQVERPQAREMVVGHRVVRVAVHSGRREVLGLARERRLDPRLAAAVPLAAAEVLARRRHQVPVVQRPARGRLIRVHLLRHDGGQVALPAGRYRRRHEAAQHDIGVEQQHREEVGVAIGRFAAGQVRTGGLHRANAGRQQAWIPLRRAEDRGRQSEGWRGVPGAPASRTGRGWRRARPDARRRRSRCRQ